MSRDTTKEAKQLQLDIILSKSFNERALMGVDMIDTTYELSKRIIKKNHPGIDKGELISRLFLKYYRKEFTKQKLYLITRLIKEAYRKKP